MPNLPSFTTSHIDYGQLLNSTSRVVGQAKQFSAQIAAGVKQANTV